MAQVRTIIFEKRIAEKLFYGNEFLLKSESHDQWAEGAESVRIPQAGFMARPTMDRTVLPAIIKKRTDSYLEYDLHQFTMNPFIIEDLDRIQLSYDLLDSVMKQQMNLLRDEIALRAFYQWSGSSLVSAGGQIILTTGTATANICPLQSTDDDGVATGTAPSGNRLAVKLLDIALCAAKLDTDGVPQQDRYMAMPARMFHNMLIENPTLTSRDYLPDDRALELGAVKKVWGINIIPRGETAVYADASTPTLKAVHAASAATDHYAAIGWQMDSVAKALGAIRVLVDKEERPEYYGRLISALVYFEATKLRSDAKGIVTMVQDS